MRVITYLLVITAIFAFAACGGTKKPDLTPRVAALETAVRALEAQQVQHETDLKKIAEPDPTARIAALEVALREAQSQREADTKRIAELEALVGALKDSIASVSDAVRELEAQKLVNTGLESMEIKSQSFTLVDKDGRARGRLGFTEGGQPGLWLLDETGQARVSVAPSESGWALLLRGESGAVQTALDCGKGGSGLVLGGADVNRGIFLVTDPGGTCGISITDSNGVPRAVMQLDGDGNASVSLRDANRTLRGCFGKSRLMKEAAGGRPLLPESGLILIDREGKVTWQAP